MNTYSLTFGSFERGGNYPLEADYIFSSVEDLQQWCLEENAKEDGGILHDGLLKIVKTEDSLILYWCYNKEFYPLCDLSTFKNLERLKHFVKDVKKIIDLINNVKQDLHQGFKNLQDELDLTQLSIGCLNPSGAFSTSWTTNTHNLQGCSTIYECLIKLDDAFSQVAIDAFINDAYYDPTTEKLVFIFNTRKEGLKTVRVDVATLIREWNVDNNGPSKVVELTREIYEGGGVDKLSADVRLSTNGNNILQKDGNTLLVDGSPIKELQELIKNLQGQVGNIPVVDTSSLELEIKEIQNNINGMNKLFAKKEWYEFT